jgi:hypothetical protein
MLMATFGYMVFMKQGTKSVTFMGRRAEKQYDRNP